MLLMPPAAFTPTLRPVSSAYSLMALHITQNDSGSAPGTSFPVDVLMKSAPEYIAMSDAFFTLSSVPSAPVSSITFRVLSAHRALSSSVSSASVSKSELSMCPAFWTISISSAPS